MGAYWSGRWLQAQWSLSDYRKDIVWIEFLNQAHAGHRPVHTWFLKIVSVRTAVYVCVCPEAINNYWHDMA